MNPKKYLLPLLILTASFHQAHAQYASFPEIVINLSLPDYSSLKFDGGIKELTDTGIRGILLYRASATTYIAYDKNCSHHPYDVECSTVEVDFSRLFLKDPCCNSTFNFSDGMPTGGPASRPLIRYRTELVGSVLTITDEIVN
jgi:nitrite reductase/ring-hydroxylating ferredoxin subunit